MILRSTPFHSRTSALMQGQAWRRWAGYAVASSYELTHEHEYAAIRNAAALLDITPLYKYTIAGRDAARLLDRIVTRNVGRSKVGQVMYTPWCDARGKVLDDGTVSRLAEDFFRLTSAEPNLRWIMQNAVGLDVKVEDVSDKTAALALQGPTSRAILQRVVESADVGALKFFRVAAGSIRGIPVTISRTGYTGDLGFELWADAMHAEALWDALMEAGEGYGITPTGILALDMARIEAGLILLEVDYVSARHAVIEMQKSSPYELNLGWAVSLDKGSFVGDRALRAEHARGPGWRFVGLDVEWDSLEQLYRDVGLPPKLPSMAWRVSVPLYNGGVQVGYATSGCWSPILKKYIALAHVESEHTLTGGTLEMEVTVEHRRKRATVRVVELPFFNPPRKRE